ncbi:MAG: hypothetical protein V7637_1710 [Mycobacteriales bacterium]|jgi:hypothetical protein
MTEPNGDDTRSIADEGTQADAQASPAAGRSAGPAPSVGGHQEPGGPVPPYEGRRESADIDADGAHRDGARVGGATGPRVADEPADDPAGTPRGRVASPADGDDETEVAGYEPDPGVGPAHQAGVRKGENQPDVPG